MCFLDIEEEDGKIIISKEGMQLASVKALYNTDKNAGKTFFKKCMTYIFYVYNPEGIYKNKLLSIRQKEVCEKYLDGEDWDKYNSNKKLQDVVIDYLDLCLTPTEQLVIKFNKEIDNILQRLSEIPNTREMIFDFDVDGRIEKKKIIADNSKEKKEAIEIGIKLLDYQKLLKEKVKIDKDEKKKKSDFMTRQFSDS